MFSLFAKCVQCLVVATNLCEHLFPLMEQNKNTKITINRYTFVINNKSDLNTNFKPYINKLVRNKCATFPENMIRCEIVGITQMDNLIYVSF